MFASALIALVIAAITLAFPAPAMAGEATAARAGLEGGASSAIRISPQEEALVTEDESNDSSDEATEISVNTAIRGEAYNTTSSSRFVGVTDYFDYDFFKFTVASPSKLSVSLNSDVVMGKEADWLTSRSGVRLVGYQSAALDIRIASVESLDEGDMWDYEMSPSGTKKWKSGNLYLKQGEYYALVYANASSNIWGHDYDFTVNCEAVADAEISPNNSYETATEIEVDKSYQGSFYNPGSSNDYDYFKFTLPSAMPVTFSLNTDVVMGGSGAKAGLSLCTEESYQTTEEWDYTMSPSGTKKWESDAYELEAGTHYLRVEASTANGGIWGHDYTLMVNGKSNPSETGTTPPPSDAPSSDAPSSDAGVRDRDDTPAARHESNLAAATITPLSDAIYTGLPITPLPVVRIGGVWLTAGADFTVSYVNNLNVGVATVVIAGTGEYNGANSTTFRILKAPNPLRVDVRDKTLKWKKVKTKARVLKGAIKVRGARGTVTFAKLSKGSSKRLAVDKTKGWIKVKKRTKPGVYTIRVKVKASGDANHKKASTVETLEVLVE